MIWDFTLCLSGKFSVIKKVRGHQSPLAYNARFMVAGSRASKPSLPSPTFFSTLKNIPLEKHAGCLMFEGKSFEEKNIIKLHHYTPFFICLILIEIRLVQAVVQLFLGNLSLEFYQFYRLEQMHPSLANPDEPFQQQGSHPVAPKPL